MLTLAEVIAKVESANNQYALRFEPMTYDRLASSNIGVVTPIMREIMNKNACSAHTSKMVYSTSFGLYQFMGFNLYDRLQIGVSVGEFMANRLLQDRAFDKFVTLNKINFTVVGLMASEDARLEFASRYNGPGNTKAYADRLNAVLNG